MSHSGWSSSNYITVNGTPVTALPLTIHARLKQSAQSTNRACVAIGSDTSNYISLGYNSSTLRLRIVTAGTATNYSSGSGALSTGAWASIVGVFNTTTDRRGYVDGVEQVNNTVSKTTPTISTVRIGDSSALSETEGSLAEVAIWNVALSTDEIAALVFKSPKSIRPDALVTYLKLLDNGSRDEVALPATVTGTLTKDTDHPRVYYQRRNSGLWTPNFTTGGGEEQAVGSSAGSATAAATGQSTARASGSAAGTATAAATGQSTAASVGSAAGTSTVDGVGTFTGEVEAVGTAAGTSTASAVGTSTGGVTQIGPADDRPARRKRRDRETLEAYYAALQRKANEDAEREKLEALAEAERALEEAENAKKAEAKRAAVRKVFAALDRAALTEKAKAGAREAEQAALEAIAKRQTQEQREAYLDALDQLNVEIEMIGAQIARLYARRHEEEQFLLQRWFAA